MNCKGINLYGFPPLSFLFFAILVSSLKFGDEVIQLFGISFYPVDLFVESFTDARYGAYLAHNDMGNIRRRYFQFQQVAHMKFRFVYFGTFGIESCGEIVICLIYFRLQLLPLVVGQLEIRFVSLVLD